MDWTIPVGATISIFVFYVVLCALFVFALVKRKTGVFVPFIMVKVGNKTSGQKIVSTLFFLIQCAVLSFWIYVCYLAISSKNYPLSGNPLISISILGLLIIIPIILTNMLFFSLRKIWD